MEWKCHCKECISQEVIMTFYNYLDNKNQILCGAVYNFCIPYNP